jgi:hypothetical protein
MTFTGTITTSKPRDTGKISFKLSSDSAFFPSSIFFIKNVDNLCERKKIINMPMNLFLRPQMPLYSLVKSIQRRPNIGVTSFWKMNDPLFSYHDRGVIAKFHDKEIGPSHQRCMSIGSYKTDSVSSSDGIA